MAEIQVRPAQLEDLARLAALDPGYETDYVWQMDHRDDLAAGQIQITFRPARLPRPMRVNVPRDAARLVDDWNRRICFVVAEQDGQLKGLLNLTLAPAPDTAWIGDCVVDRSCRRVGVGSVLLAAAAHWARSNRLRRLVLEMQSKNYPAICFAQKHGFAFSGYNDRYYPNQEVALYFGLALK
jgi:ribosomal protein S18 acetylase RimI-like enzyme